MIYPKRYLVTSALPYANGPLHIGHLTGAYISADIYVRFLRLLGKDVVWVCGSDEHGAAITMRAMKEGLTPQEVVDRYHVMLQDSFAKLGISFDIYHRTSSALHHETSQEFFRTLYAKGVFEERTTEQYYDEKAAQFLADRYIKGTCPKCAHPDAYGDQCENCGSSLSPTDLINPVSTLSGSKPILKETMHWYLPLNKDEVWLREWIEAGKLNGIPVHDPEEWKAHVMGQCKSWLDSGLQPRAITRDLNWGVDVPPEIPGSQGKKLYVWMDAPIGYISATKQWAIDTGNDWRPYWQDSESALIHFIGKDNIVFHCLIFPAILRAHGEYILPMNVPANQFMNLESTAHHSRRSLRDLRIRCGSDRRRHERDQGLLSTRSQLWPARTGQLFLGRRSWKLDQLRGPAVRRRAVRVLLLEREQPGHRRHERLGRRFLEGDVDRRMPARERLERRSAGEQRIHLAQHFRRRSDRDVLQRRRQSRQRRLERPVRRVRVRHPSRRDDTSEPAAEWNAGQQLRPFAHGVEQRRALRHLCLALVQPRRRRHERLPGFVPSRSPAAIDRARRLRLRWFPGEQRQLRPAHDSRPQGDHVHVDGEQHRPGRHERPARHFRDDPRR